MNKIGWKDEGQGDWFSGTTPQVDLKSTMKGESTFPKFKIARITITSHRFNEFSWAIFYGASNKETFFIAPSLSHKLIVYTIM